MRQSYSGNIPKLYIIKIAKWFMLIMPIIVLFYQENGLSIQDVFVLKGIYSIAVVLLEIPSGYLADAWGRKSTLILGSILGCLGFVIYSLSFNFYGFLAAELVLGIGGSFISGSDSALLYDSLKAEGKEKNYLKLEGRIMSMGNFAEALAGVCGGLLAGLSLRYPFIAQSGIAFLAIPASFMLIEPQSEKTKEEASFMHILRIVKYALWENKKLRWNIVYSSVIGCATLTLAWFLQPYFEQIGLSVSQIGFVWAGLNLCVGLVGLVAYKIENKLGKINTSILIIIGISGGFILTALFDSLIAILFVFIFYLTRGIATPVLKNYINELTESNVRATVLSLRNFIIRIFFAIIGPFLGWYTDKMDIQSALILAGSIFFILALISLICIRKIEKL